MKYNILCVILLVSSFTATASLSNSERDAFKKQLEKISYSYPTMINDNTRADKMWLERDTVYLSLTGVDLDSALLEEVEITEINRKMKSALIKQYCYDKNFIFFRDKSLTLSRILHDKNSDFLIEVSVDNNDCVSLLGQAPSIQNRKVEVVQIIKTTSDDSKYRTLFQLPVYKFPPPPSKVNNVIYEYDKGDYIKFKYDICDAHVCQAVTPNGDVGWIYGYKVTDSTDLNNAHIEYNNAGFDEWSKVDFMVWYSIKDDLNKIDSCALKIAYNININRDTGWPAYCNRIENTAQVKNRVKEIDSILHQLSPSDDELKKMKEGNIWIGATSEHLLLSWGTPVDINSTLTATSQKEQWVYSSGNYVYLTNGLVSAIQN